MTTLKELRESEPLIIKEQNQIETKYMGSSYDIEAEVVTWDTLPIDSPSKFRTKIKVYDGSASIDAFYFGIFPSNIHAGTKISFTSKLQGYRKGDSPTVYRSLNIKGDITILSGGESLPQQGDGSAGNPITLPDPPIEIGFSDTKYLPTERELAQKYHVLYSFYEDLKRLFGENKN